MKYIGSKFVNYDGREFFAEEYIIDIEKNIWERLLSVSSIKELGIMLEERINDEDYESAQDIKKEIEKRKQ